MPKNPLTLTDSQRNDIAARGEVRLDRHQVGYLRAHGLIADAWEWYYHPTGSYALAPTHPDARRGKDGRRKRVTLAPVTTRDAA